jgi:hypothetical protein
MEEFTMHITFIKVESIKDSRLYKAVKRFMEVVSTSRTQKYLCNTKDFDGRLESVVRTLYVLRATFSTSIQVGEETFLLSEYKVPAKLQNFLDAGRIFMTSDAIGRVNPCQVERVEGDIYTPLEFNAFWDEFNRDQGDDVKLTLTDGYVRNHVILANLQFCEDGSSGLVRLNDSGFDAEDCYLIGVSLSDAEGYTRYPGVTLDGIARNWSSR